MICKFEFNNQNVFIILKFNLLKKKTLTKMKNFNALKGKSLTQQKM